MFESQFLRCWFQAFQDKSFLISMKKIVVYYQAQAQHLYIWSLFVTRCFELGFEKPVIGNTRHFSKQIEDEAIQISWATLLGFLGNMSSQDHLLQLLKLLQTKPLFYCTFCSAFSLDKFCGLCHTILLSKSRCVPPYGKTLILVQKLDSPYSTRHFCKKLQYFPNKTQIKVQN